MWSGDSIVQTSMITVSFIFLQQSRLRNTCEMCTTKWRTVKIYFDVDLINDENGFEELFGDTAFDASLAQLFNINTEQLLNGLRECMTGQGMLSTLIYTAVMFVF